MSQSIKAILLALVCMPAWALDGNAILAQVDRNMAPESYEMYRKLINQEPDGSRKDFVLYTAKKGRTSMVALFLSPASDIGRTTLRIGDNMWLYIPSVGKPLRITSLQSVVGGIFNNSDLMRLEFSIEYEVTDVIEQDDEFILDLKARVKTVAYDRLKMQVDRKLLLPTRIEAYAASGLLVKTLNYRKIKDFGDGIRRPSVLETESPLYKGYKAIMLFAKIQSRSFDDEVFSLNFMPRVQELRQ